MNKKTIKDINLQNRKVFARCDFNVPLDDNGNITDDNRIKAALPTIKYLLENDCEIVLCSHLGRPKGEFNDKYSLKPVAQRLSELLEKDVKLTNDVIGESAKELTSKMKPGDIVLLENVRFDEREEKNDDSLSKELASLVGENGVFVNDAFGAAHRAHSSTAGIAKFVSESVAGFLMEKEIKVLGDVLDNPDRPFVAILGGAKVKDKIGVIRNLLDKVDTILIGGGMAYTFIKAQGKNIGGSICDNENLETAKELMQLAEEKGVNLELPIDTKIGKEFDADTASMNVKISDIPDDWKGLDIGDETIKRYEEILSYAKTVVWNGPLGVFEFPAFAVGTNKIAEFLSKKNGITTIIGGGDSAAAIEKLGISDKFSHISTGGGASLEFLEGRILPGVECLNNK